MPFTQSSIRSNADTGPSIAAFLSAFGVSAHDPYAMPSAFRPKYESLWLEWLTKYGSVGSSNLAQLMRIFGFVGNLSRRGYNNLYLTPLKIAGKRVTIKTMQETIVKSELNRAVFAILTMLRKTDVFVHMRVTRSKAELNGQNLITTMQLEKRRQVVNLSDILLMQLKDVLRFREIPPQLRDTILPGRKDSKPQYTTPKADTLLNQFDSSFGWLPLVKDSDFEAYIIRARDQKLVLKVVVPLDSHVVKLSTRASLFKLWAAAFRSVKNTVNVV